MAVWLGSAMAAEAQPTIEPTGPLAVTDTDTSSTYTANITATGNFYVKLRVYLNATLKHDGAAQLITWGGGTYSYSKDVDMVGWGQVVGDTLLYRLQAWYNPMQKRTADWTVTVTPGMTYFNPGFHKSPRFDAIPAERDRRMWA